MAPANPPCLSPMTLRQVAKPHRRTRPTRQASRIRASTAALALTVLTTACATTQRTPAPVVERSFVEASQPGTYTVRKDDTLYSIAWRHNLEYRALAAANGIESPYTVYPGQSIRLRQTVPVGAAAPVNPPAVPRPEANAARPVPAPQPKPAPVAKPPPTARPTSPTAPTTSVATSPVAKPPAAKPATPPPNAPAAGKWRKPVDDRPERRFGGNSKGFDYSLAPATQVRAAAGGVVVYAGPGLGGYQHLVIVKVSERYLVAYGFNVAPKLKEGDSVAAGAVVAEIASGGTAAGRFHFEIRDRGKPVDPSSLIAS